MRAGNDTLIAADVDVTGGWTSQAICTEHVLNYSIQITVAGGAAPTGTFKLQFSNDLGSPNSASEAEREVAVTHWTDITSATSAITTNGDVQFNRSNDGFRWVRVVFTFTSGTGNITYARFQTKGY